MTRVGTIDHLLKWGPTHVNICLLTLCPAPRREASCVERRPVTSTWPGSALASVRWLVGLGRGPVSTSVAIMEIVTSCDRPDLKCTAEAAFRVKWPEFLFPHDPVMLQREALVVEFFPQFDVLMLDGDRVVAGGWGVPIRWDGTMGDLPAGYDSAMVRAVEGHQSGVEPNTLVYMTVAVVDGETGRGLAAELLTALRKRGVEAGLSRVIAPVRPTLQPQ